MSATYENYEILFAVYGTEDGAAGAVDALKRLDKADAIDIIDAATLVKDAEGNSTVKQESLPSIKKGVGVGALIGGAVGLLFPPSILAAAALGAGVGAGSAKLASMALENDDLKNAADSLEPGSSAFIAVVDNTWVKQLQEVIAGYDNLAAHTLDADAAGVIGTLANDSEAMVYGSAVTDTASMEFAAATDGNVIAGRASSAQITEDGTLVTDEVSGVVAADADGNVAAVTSETIAAVDAEGNAAIASGVEATYIPAEPAADEDPTE